MNDLIGFMGGGQNNTQGALLGYLNQLMQQKLHPVEYKGANNTMVNKGGAIGYYGSDGVFHQGNSFGKSVV